MQNIFDNILKSVETGIIKAPSIELKDINFKQRMISGYTVTAPELIKTKTTAIIGKDIITMNNAPSGISFHPGQDMDFVQYSVPIDSSLTVFNNIFDGRLDTNKVNYGRFALMGNNLIYKILSPTPILGNDEVVNELKARFVSALSNIEDKLKEFSELANKFNQVKLIEFVNETIKKELEKRSIKENTELKLNPFA